MAAHKRWRLVNPQDPSDEYTFWPNPKKMSSPFPKKAITTAHSSSPRGQHLNWEGPTPATEWSFGGTILTPEQYEALRSWVYDRSGEIYVYDHFGRRLTCILRSFDPESPERMKNGRYWYHQYMVHALVFNISEPTVGDIDA